MRKRLLSLIMAICMVFSLIPAAAAAESPVTVTVAGQENATYAAEVFAQVNSVRAETGAETVTRNAILSELAMQRAAEIALYFSHTRPDGSSWSTIIDGAYSGWADIGENIAVGQMSPSDVMDSWMNSDGHRGNILDPVYTQIGVGCFYAGGYYFWVQLFGNSTTDLEETVKTGTTNVARTVNILPSNLNPEPAGSMNITLDVGQTHTLTITSSNPEFPGAAPTLIVTEGSVTNPEGVTIATRTVSPDGTITITAENYGSAAMDIPAYEGQSKSLRLYITVTDEVIPTEPEPTETQPVETEPVETEPVETEPVETEPVETEPVETEPVETEPVETEPVETEPVETEPVETEPVETEPVETEPVETEPVETEPVETEPVETEPVETEPVETEPVETEPTEPDDGIIASGFCGSNASWSLDSTGTLTISGSGVMTGYSQKGAPWYPYADQIRHLVVGNEITQISSYAFSHCTELVSVELPEHMYYIDYCAFEYCSSLTGITLPDGIPVIEAGMLRGCTSLVSVVIPDGVTMISDDAFGGCTGLQAVVIPDTVTHIEFNAFMGCPVTIYCYQLSEAHVYAARNDYDFQLMEDEPRTPTYDVSITTNDGGVASITPNPSPANRYVVFEVSPDKGYILDQVYYLCAANPGQELEFTQIGDNQYMFLMPRSDVILDVYFIATASPFSDVKEGDFYFEPVLWAVSYGITSGMGNGKFAPNDSCTRAQVVTFLWRAAGEPEPAATVNPFKDVKESDYFYKAVLWAVENGITTGISADRFGPNSPCTRAQVVTFLWRAAGEPAPHASTNEFKDVKATEFYYSAVLWAVENNITTGLSATSFGPNATCTRGQVVTFLYRFLR